MAINEPAILGQDTTVTFATAGYTGTLVNRESVTWGFRREREEFSPGSSVAGGYVTPRKRIPPIVIRIMRGLGQTAKDLKEAFDDQVVTALVITDFIANPTEFAAMVAEYGTCGVIGVDANQPGGAGTVDITLEFGYKAHGYTPAS